MDASNILYVRKDQRRQQEQAASKSRDAKSRDVSERRMAATTHWPVPIQKGHEKIKKKKFLFYICYILYNNKWRLVLSTVTFDNISGGRSIIDASKYSQICNKYKYK